MKGFILILLFSNINCIEQIKESNERDSIKLTETAIWKVYRTKDSIPKIFYHAYFESRGKEFLIANPSEEWQKTDVILRDSIPTRQLKFIANKGNDWRISYEEGGFGRSKILAEFQIFGDTLKNYRGTYTNLNIDNNDSVESHLKHRRLVLP